MAEYGLPALAGGRLRSTFSKPHGRRNPACLLLDYRNTMPAQLPNADKIEARDTGDLQSVVSSLTSKKIIPRWPAMKLIMEDPGIWREIGQYHWVPCLTSRRCPSQQEIVIVIIASFPTNFIWLHGASTALRSMLHVERRGEVSLSFIRLRRGFKGSDPKCALV